jgi:flagellar hook protein FlgE
MNITSLSGMQSAQAQVDRSASRIASLPAAAQQPSDSVDLSTEMVALLQGRNDFAANAKAFEIQDQTTQNVLNLVA